MSKDKSELYSKQIKSWDHEVLKIPKPVIDALVDMNIMQPSKIQAAAIQVMVEKEEKGYRNMRVQSKNGTGKTLAYVLGSILRIDPKIQGVQVIVLVPARELAKQTFNVYKKVLKFTPEIKVSLLVPGEETKDLGHVVIGTPGSIHYKGINENKKKFDTLRVLIIDEADSTLNPKNDFTKDVMPIIKKTNPKKQVALFSATYNPEIIDHINKNITDVLPITFESKGQQTLTLDRVFQVYMNCKSHEKYNLVIEVFKKIDVGQSIVFCRKIDDVNTLGSIMEKNGFKVSKLTSELKGKERDAAEAAFRSRATQMLITTDVIARGYDNRFVSLVINLNIPYDVKAQKPNPEEYLHRIGRTGRFGDFGLALTIIDNEHDKHNFQEVIKALNSKPPIETNLDKLAEQYAQVKKIREEEELEQERLEEKALLEAKKKKEEAKKAEEKKE